MRSISLLKPSQNKKGRKNFRLPAVKKYSKNGAAGKFFGPSYFDPALVLISFSAKLKLHNQ